MSHSQDVQGERSRDLHKALTCDGRHLSRVQRHAEGDPCILGHSYLLHQGLVHLERLPQLKVVCMGLAEATHHLQTFQGSCFRDVLSKLSFTQVSETCMCARELPLRAAVGCVLSLSCWWQVTPESLRLCLGSKGSQ